MMLDKHFDGGFLAEYRVPRTTDALDVMNAMDFSEEM